jgi:Phage terminase large subunit/Terminase RNaseH-like domain
LSIKLTDKQEEVLPLLTSDKRCILGVGGARSGKTFLFVLATLIRALKAPYSRHVIFRFRANSVWSSIGLDTLPKVARLLGCPLKCHAQDKYFELANGAQVWLCGLDDKDRVDKILGMEFVTLYFNEASQIPYSSYIVAKTRLAQVCPEIPQRLYCDLNPSGTGHWTNRLFIGHVDPDNPRKEIIDPYNYGHFVLNPYDNLENLTEDYLSSLESMPERYRRRFFEGKYASEIDGALWSLDVLERCHCDAAPAVLRRVVVAIDPSGTAGEEDKRSDAVGIIVAGKGMDGKAYILADLTTKAGPEQWAAIAVTALRDFGADCIVAERNFGGAMVESVIRNISKHAPFREVVASRGKAVRAEPVALMYSRGFVCHVGRYPELEDQLENFTSSGYTGLRSPDRADALIWAVSFLLDTSPPMVVDKEVLQHSRVSVLGAPVRRLGRARPRFGNLRWGRTH